MAEYQLTESDVVIRTADSMFVPNDPGNNDRRAYEEWLDAGGVPDPYVPPVSVTFDPQLDMGNSIYAIVTG